MPLGKQQWLRYLRAQGYTDTESQALMDGAGRLHPGLRREVPRRLQITIGNRHERVAGIVVDYLAARPPATILTLSERPPAFLSARDMGARLRPVFESGELGELYADVLTGARWELTQYTSPQTAAVLVAATLYRHVRVAAPGARPVVMGGQLQVAWPRLSGWRRIPPAQRHERVVAELAQQAPADAWLHNEAMVSGVRYRSRPIRGMSATLRLQLSGTLGYRSRGRRSKTWPRAALPDFRRDRAARPMLERVAGVPVGVLRAAVDRAQLAPEVAAGLVAELVTRQELLRAQLV